MDEKKMERAVFLTGPEQLAQIEESYERLYFGQECCHWRLPKRRELEDARKEADRRGMGFTLVTPLLSERGLKRALSLAEHLGDDEAAEVVVNDAGLLEELSRRSWKGRPVIGRLLTRQKRGAGWKSPMPGEEEAREYLRSSSLESTRMVEWFRDRYGVRRFEIDDLGQGVRVGPLPGDVRLSVYTPYVLVTVTRLCPWTFDGRRWVGSEGCAAPCRGDLLVLHPEEGGEPLCLGGGGQFLKTRHRREVFSGPAVDRLIVQPFVPA